MTGYDAVAGKLKTMGPQLQMVNASNLLVIAKDEAGKVTVDALDVGSSAGLDLMAMAEQETFINQPGRMDRRISGATNTIEASSTGR